MTQCQFETDGIRCVLEEGHKGSHVSAPETVIKIGDTWINILVIDDFPKDEIWLVSKNEVCKIVNIGEPDNDTDN